MPELPEVETTRKSLEPLLGAQVQSVETSGLKLRWRMAAGLERLIGKSLYGAERRAKYLILTFAPKGAASGLEQTERLIIHLGMSGSLQQYSKTKIGDYAAHKHDHLVFQLHTGLGTVYLAYHDPRRFGAVVWHHEYQHKLLSHLGPEPLSDAFNGDYLKRHIGSSNRAIKSLIMDQTCVVGVGNIYAAESLFLAGIHPSRHGSKISQARLQTLCMHIKAVLTEAITQGGSTLRDYRHNDGKTGYFQQKLRVYGRAGQPCTLCGTLLKNKKINNRASAYCPKCQT